MRSIPVGLAILDKQIKEGDMNAWLKNVVRLAVSLWFLALVPTFGLWANAQNFSGWSTPVNLGSTINTSFFEG